MLHTEQLTTRWTEPLLQCIRILFNSAKEGDDFRDPTPTIKVIAWLWLARKACNNFLISTLKEPTMDKPKIAARNPAKVEVEEGKKYAWCSCGLSENQPFCDGKHKGTDFVPVVFTAEKSELCYFCQCKHSGKGMLCDGAHNDLPEEA